MNDIPLPLSDDGTGPGSALPTTRLKDAAIDPPMYILALSQIRKAEILRKETLFATATGYVTGHPGDIAITMPRSGEVYPIPAKIFYGGYEVLGRVGDRLIARRHIQVRIAWEIASEQGEFTWPNGNVNKVTRGDWLYQSDDHDFGMQKAEGQQAGYIKVGQIDKTTGRPWAQRFERLAWRLNFLPALLTAIALLSLGLAENSHEQPATVLTILETLLLAGGVGAYLWARQGRWELKAALNIGAEATTRFQPAAELLGEIPSAVFPLMPLSRAAQTEPSSGQVPVYSADNEKTLRALRRSLGSRIEEIRRKIDRSDRIEKGGLRWAAVSVAVVILSNLWLIVFGHVPWLALATLWLPSMIGALHALGHRKRVVDQVPLLQQFKTQLEIIEAELLRLATWTATEEQDRREEREAALRLLCKVICQYSQAELRLAISQLPEVPL